MTVSRERAHSTGMESTTLVAAAVDEKLNEVGYVVPGSADLALQPTMIPVLSP